MKEMDNETTSIPLGFAEEVWQRTRHDFLYSTHLQNTLCSV